MFLISSLSKNFRNSKTDSPQGVSRRLHWGNYFSCQRQIHKAWSSSECSSRAPMSPWLWLFYLDWCRWLGIQARELGPHGCDIREHSEQTSKETQPPRYWSDVLNRFFALLMLILFRYSICFSYEWRLSSVNDGTWNLGSFTRLLHRCYHLFYIGVFVAFFFIVPSAISI